MKRIFSPAALALLALLISTIDVCAEEKLHCDDLRRDSFQQGSQFSKSPWSLEATYVIGWTRGAGSPALVTTSADSSSRSEAGVLSNPTVRVLFGDQKIDSGNRSGGRFLAMRSLDKEGLKHLYFGGMYLADDYQSGDYSASSAGLPILARPFLDAQTQQQDSQLVAFPSVLEGTVTVNNYSEMYLGDIGFRQALLRGTVGELYAITGYRYLNFRDTISVTEDLRSIDLGGAIPLNTTFMVQDSFSARNEFHGANLGLGLRSHWNSWAYGASASVGLGGFAKRLSVSGQTQVNVPTLSPDIQPGGLLALPTNIGSYNSTAFAAVPEFRAFASRRITESLSFDLGYDFLLLPGIWRASEQINPTINQSQIGGGALVGPAQPTFAASSRDTWVQGIRLGVGLAW